MSGLQLRWFLSPKALLAAGSVLITAVATPSKASTLVLDSVERVNSTMADADAFNLTTLGTYDWALWDQTGSNYATLAPSNRKAGGSLIGSLTPVNGGTLRGSASTTAGSTAKYTYSDGTSPTSITDPINPGLIFNSQLGSAGVTAKAGFAVSVGGLTGVDQYVRLFFGGFSNTAQLDVTLPGAAPLQITSQPFAQSPKQMEIYTLKYRPDNASDTLGISYIMPNSSNGSSHVGVNAIAVSNTPEPGAISLLVAGGLLALRRRRTA